MGKINSKTNTGNQSQPYYTCSVMRNSHQKTNTGNQSQPYYTCVVQRK